MYPRLFLGRSALFIVASTAAALATLSCPKQTRTVKTPDGDEQEVLPGQTHFDPPFQDTLVVPPAPWFSNLLNETVDVNCGAHKVYILQYTMYVYAIRSALCTMYHKLECRR